MSLSEDEMNIIKIISLYSVINEMIRQHILDKDYFTEWYNGLSEFSKVVLTNYELSQTETIQEMKKIINKNK